MIRIEENVVLAPYTSFRVGGQARYFVAVTSTEELQEALTQAKAADWPVFILAAGSNVIVSSLGFDGLVIQVKIAGYSTEGNIITSGAAELMSTLVDASIGQGLAGLEWAGGLPGTFGGAIRGNAGAFGGEIKDSIATVTSVHQDSHEITTRHNNECQFGYRESIFKTKPNEIIISATVQLKSGDKEELRKIADDHISYRQTHHPLEYPNSGSIFKNTPVEKVPADILPQFKDVIKTDPFPVVPTAKIIADAGLSGTQIGQAQVSTKHTNYIVNLGGATGEDIVGLINKVKEVVQTKFGITLEVEPELLGF